MKLCDKCNEKIDNNTTHHIITIQKIDAVGRISSEDEYIVCKSCMYDIKEFIEENLQGY